MHANNLGVLVVHMQEGYKYHLKSYYPVLRLIETATQSNVPIFFTKVPGYGSVLKELYSELLSESYEFSEGGNTDCFAGDSILSYGLWVKNVKRIVLAGFNKYICVYATAAAALEEGFSLATSKDLLFHVGMITETIDEFYHTNSAYYNTVEDLIAVEFGTQRRQKNVNK